MLSLGLNVIPLQQLPQSSTTTVLGCGNASGFAVPPYFVFKGKRMMDDLINGATPGAAGTVSETGWSNSICQTISSTSYQAEMMTQYFCFLMDISHMLLWISQNGHKSATLFYIFYLLIRHIFCSHLILGVTDLCSVYMITNVIK